VNMPQDFGRFFVVRCYDDIGRPTGDRFFPVWGLDQGHAIDRVTDHHPELVFEAIVADEIQFKRNETRPFDCLVAECVAG